MSEFRKLDRPFVCLPATKRSQAIQGLRCFGPMTEETLATKFGVDRATLDRLLAEGLLENKKHKGLSWWRLTPAGEMTDP